MRRGDEAIELVCWSGCAKKPHHEIDTFCHGGRVCYSVKSFFESGLLPDFCKSGSYLCAMKQNIQIMTHFKDYRERWKVKHFLEGNKAQPKHSVYTEAIDIYRHAYMEAHYPDIFRRVIAASEK